MEIEKAIRILEWDLEDRIMPHKASVREAEQLGIEALKRLQKLRGYSMTQVDTRLPGETEE